MIDFPLYDSLETTVQIKDLTVKQKKEFIENIENIDTKGAELIYALIEVYHIKNDDSVEHLPYKGTENNNNLSWYIGDIPIKLRQILYKFVTMHIKSMEEEAIRII